VAAGLAGLVRRMYDVILFCFDYRNIGFCISPLFSRSMTHYFSPKLYAPLTLHSRHYPNRVRCYLYEIIWIC